MSVVGPFFYELPAAERQAILERLAVTLERNARWAAEQGDDALEMVMRSVGTALLSVAGDLATTDITLTQDVAARAVNLITTFHCRYPEYPVGPTLH
ncbi:MULTISPECIES: hypothetical protein [Rhizobium]|uniref:hypothetical protein n=1 Tax=Rhizobium TaxID=379 RepID=UPI001105FB06|nr:MULTISPECIES: hypothetical protein [Rhizobium]NYT33539.1 hypothetical protein [Rhizobium sp. WYCCWR 11128]QKK33083.1 hypothetical protein FE844_026075 [Rhizobium indicum]